MRPTKADVARLANVSTATVSYVLNNVQGQRISEQTQAAVRKAAADLGYRPNLAARNLAVGGSGVVLYIVGRLWGPELARRVQKGVEYFPDPPYADVPIPATIR